MTLRRNREGRLAGKIKDLEAVMKNSAYVTDYFYFAVRQDTVGGRDVLVYTSGVNLDRFLPMMRGRLGLGSNPIVGGLQLVKYDLCRLAISEGALPKDQGRIARNAEVILSEGAWYGESLLIDNPGEMCADDIVNFCVDNYAKKVAACSLEKYEAPKSLIAPCDMQAQLDTLCKAA